MVPAKDANLVELAQILVQYLILTFHVVPQTFAAVLPQVLQPDIFANGAISGPPDPHRETLEVEEMVAVRPEVDALLQTDGACGRGIQDVAVAG